MPRPFNERQSWEQERDELPKQIGDLQRQLEATLQINKIRREDLSWRIRRDERRMVELEGRLARPDRVAAGAWAAHWICRHTGRAAAAWPATVFEQRREYVNRKPTH